MRGKEAVWFIPVTKAIEREGQIRRVIIQWTADHANHGGYHTRAQAREAVKLINSHFKKEGLVESEGLRAVQPREPFFKT